MSLPMEVKETAPAGRRSYLTLGIAAASHSVIYMYTALMPITYPHAMAQIGFSNARIGLMPGVGSGLSSMAQGAYGFLSRRVMRRVIRGATPLSLC